MELVELMHELQGRKPVALWAQELGINRSTLNKIYRGKRGPGRAVVRALVRRYPERRDEILSLFLSRNGDNRIQKESDRNQ
ncbi:MAG: hypothetical protein GXY68_04510 [Chloroflexi bacterium]|jgi:hypothetical protein|nr:hypothetical protein [Chloroflexota bacterium]